MPYLGAHLSAAGGVWRAVDVAAAATCDAVQLFLRPPGRWAAAASPPGEAARFRQAAGVNGVEGRCFAHAPYLLNLASTDEGLQERSRRVLVEELERAGNLGLAGVVLHPGSAGIGGNRLAAEARCREALASAVAEAGDGAARLLVEGAAGAGGQLGTTPVELARLVDACPPDRVGVCLDLAHLWVAGYDLGKDGLDQVLDEVGAAWGRSAPDLWHGNDTPSELGSHRDRHAPPGEGQLGETFFRDFLANPRAMQAPVILEIPPGDDNELVRAALARMREWAPPPPTRGRGKRGEGRGRQSPS